MRNPTRVLAGILVVLILLSQSSLPRVLAQYRLSSVPRVSTQLPAKFPNGHCSVVIGGSSGIGLSLSGLLASKNSKVVLTSRSLGKVEAIRQVVLPRENLLGVVPLELSSDASIEEAALAIEHLVKQQCGNRLDLLFLQAGMLYPFFGQVKHEVNSTDLVFRSNFIGLARLAKRLLGLLRQANTRVVISSSSMHHGGLKADVLAPVPDRDEHFSVQRRMQWYAASKVGTQALARALQNQGLFAAAMTPGVVRTEIFHINPESVLSWPLMLFMLHPDQAARHTLDAAFVTPEFINAQKVLWTPYLCPPRGDFFGQDGSFFYQLVIIGLAELTQHLTARPGFLWACPEAPLVDAIFNQMQALYFDW
jgi:NAD(P)-dependent dehydrogenase (short-subunit alcohol dehydrogenase family)